MDVQTERITMNTKLQAKHYNTSRLRTSVARLITLALGLFVALIIAFLFASCSTRPGKTAFGYWSTHVKTSACIQLKFVSMNCSAYLRDVTLS